MKKRAFIIAVLLMLAACANNEVSKDQKLEKSPCACNQQELINHAA